MLRRLTRAQASLSFPTTTCVRAYKSGRWAEAPSDVAHCVAATKSYSIRSLLYCKYSQRHDVPLRFASKTDAAASVAFVPHPEMTGHDVCELERHQQNSDVGHVVPVRT